jgi:hypothetical protein
MFEMKVMMKKNKRILVALLLIGLGSGNLLVWGCKVFKGFPVGDLYSSGEVFGVNGTVVGFSDKLKFKGDNFSLSAKYNWQDKSNAVQETGTASQGLWGQWLIDIKDSSSFGPSLLGSLELDDDFLFTRSYLQAGAARISLLPMPGEFEKNCYYFLFSKEVHCGALE